MRLFYVDLQLPLLQGIHKVVVSQQGHHVLRCRWVRPPDQRLLLLGELRERFAPVPHPAFQAGPLHFCLVVFAKLPLQCLHHAHVYHALCWG